MAEFAVNENILLPFVRELAGIGSKDKAHEYVKTFLWKARETMQLRGVRQDDFARHVAQL